MMIKGVKMIEIDIKDIDLENDNLDPNETYVIKVDGIKKYILTSYEVFEDFKDDVYTIKPQGVKVVTQGEVDINEVEYEELKKQLLDALEETLKPNVKKLS